MPTSQEASLFFISFVRLNRNHLTGSKCASHNDPRRILAKVAPAFSVKFVEMRNLQEIHGISLMVRPLLQGNAAKSQLCRPSAYAEDGDDFSDCLLFSIVAWDHVSWPGNDYFGGSRGTDDGVKAAATDSMALLTGIDGHYDPHRGAYLPPTPYRTWDDVVRQNGLRL